MLELLVDLAMLFGPPAGEFLSECTTMMITGHRATLNTYFNTLGGGAVNAASTSMPSRPLYIHEFIHLHVISLTSLHVLSLRIILRHHLPLPFFRSLLGRSFWSVLYLWFGLIELCDFTWRRWDVFSREGVKYFVGLEQALDTIHFHSLLAINHPEFVVYNVSSDLLLKIVSWLKQ
jgi:hypothetical protein